MVRGVGGEEEEEEEEEKEKWWVGRIGVWRGGEREMVGEVGGGGVCDLDTAS